jgi:hypothetical protein
MTVNFRSKLISLWHSSKQQTTAAGEPTKDKPPAYQKMSGGYQKGHRRKIRKTKNH